MAEWWRESYSLFVRNIPDWEAGDLVRVLGDAGVVFDSFVPSDRRSRRRRNFAFVMFKMEKEADKAIQLFDGKEFN